MIKISIQEKNIKKKQESEFYLWDLRMVVRKEKIYNWLI